MVPSVASFMRGEIKASVTALLSLDANHSAPDDPNCLAGVFSNFLSGKLGVECLRLVLIYPSCCIRTSVLECCINFPFLVLLCGSPKVIRDVISQMQ